MAVSFLAHLFLFRGSDTLDDVGLGDGADVELTATNHPVDTRAHKDGGKDDLQSLVSLVTSSRT